jgi:hypothetical protein
MTTIKYIKTFLLLFIVTCCLSACSQNKSDGIGLDEKTAREFLKSSLTDTTQHNVVNRKEILIKDKTKAIEFAEQILFDIYGAKEIKNQRPYNTYNIDNYWVIGGTLAKDYVGGTFLIIIDAHDYRIVRITHGK